jgi:hypothetical protein
MSATFTWTITYMQCKPTEGSYTDVVVTAGWNCNGAETANSKDYEANNYGSVSFPMPEGSFTPYDQLTQEQVLGWCWANSVNKTFTEAATQAQLDNQINPPVVQLPLPWAAPTA